jgi:hypothetical protein
VLGVEISGVVRELPLKQSKTLDDRTMPKLLKGSSKVVGDTVVYSEGSEVQVGPKVTVSTLRGEMIYDAHSNTIRGDLVVDTGENFLVEAEAGTVSFKNGSPRVSAKVLGRRQKVNNAPAPPLPSR